MVQLLQLGATQEPSPLRRVNRLPIIAAIVLVVIFFGVIAYGLGSRGLYFREGDGLTQTTGNPASTHADDLKRGIGDGIIGEPAKPTFQPAPIVSEPSHFRPAPAAVPQPAPKAAPETEDDWRARLQREQREQYLREQHRQQMARLQANDAAYDAPIAIDRAKLDKPAGATAVAQGEQQDRGGTARSALDTYAEALASGIGGQNADPNSQGSKDRFLNADLQQLGYLPNQVVSQRSRYELKRGSVIPATLITGINSDLPGRISAQVSQNVYDSATGRHLLIPQGAKLFGRYDSKVSFGQSRVLVVWTDIIFPNGSTLHIGGMAGTDAEGYGGFKDRVNRHYLRTFGSAALLAVIGAGMDMAIPESSTRATQDTASDATRRNFAETFGRVADRTIGRNLDVQPTLSIRPGYRFSVLVDQDIAFPVARF